MSEQVNTLTQRERERLQAVRQVAAGELTVKEAAQKLDVSERQMFRIVAAYRERRLAGLAHGNRGRSPRTRLPDEVRARVAQLAATVYAGYSQNRLQQALARDEGIRISRSTVRNILHEAGLTGTQGQPGMPRHETRQRLSQASYAQSRRLQAPYCHFPGAVRGLPST
jgi:transposase